MKERYVKVITGVFSVLIGLGVLGIGIFWFQIQSLETSSGINVTSLPKEAPQPKALSYGFWSTRTGKKYYPASCRYSQSIDESDRIYYISADQAESYGKELSKRCMEVL